MAVINYSAAQINAFLALAGTATQPADLANAISDVSDDIGNLSSLNTTAKTNVVAAINENFTSASNIKTPIAAAITGKGVDAAATDSAATLAEKIGQIPTGVKAQINYLGADVTATSFTATSVTLTVEKTGTYDIRFSVWKSNNSANSTGRVYLNGTALTSTVTAMSNYGERHTVSGQALTAGDVLTLYGKSSSTSYSTCVGYLTIFEQTS